ncbi:MAG: hypothetical protein ACREN2_05290, partial [Candidatus Dormibacteria bacterium]
GPASEVARHAELSGQAGLAWERRVQAAREASGVAAHRVAADQLRAAIALRPDDAATWLDLGRAEELAGRSDLSADTYRRLVERTRQSGQVDAEAAALVRLAELAGRNVADGAPLDLLAEAADAARDAADVALQLDAALAAAQVDAYRGDLARADAPWTGWSALPRPPAAPSWSRAVSTSARSSAWGRAGGRTCRLSPGGRSEPIALSATP